MSSTPVRPPSSTPQATVKEEPLDDFEMVEKKPPVIETEENAADLLYETEDFEDEDDVEERGTPEDFAHSYLEKKTECDICHKSFAFPCQLKNHYRIHTRNAPFKCDYCHMQFNQSIRLLNHRRLHTGEKPFSCQVCGKCFSTNGGLKQHLIIHSGVRPFGCPECEKRFTSKVILKQHMRIHTGEKPFECPKCEKSFRQKSALTAHFLSQHSEEWTEKT